MSARTQPRVLSFRYAVIVIAVVLALAAGSAATAVLMAVTPPTLAAAKSSGRVPVTKHQFDDARMVQVGVTRGVTVPVASNVDGHVTRYTCVVGQPIASGTSFVSVNGTPLVALFTSVPLWRDLAMNDKGPDVVALQTELAQLGYNVSTDGKYGAKTADAVARLLTAVGGEAPRTRETSDNNTVLPLSRFLWIPQRSVTPATCDSRLGARLGNGDKLFGAASADTVARVIDMPGHLLTGSRVFIAGGLRAPVNADGTITDPASVAALYDAAQATVNDPTSNSGSDSKGESADPVQKMNGQIALATPRLTNAVPPSSIVGIDGNRGCVIGDDHVFRVTILGSQLGETFVDFATAPPKSIQASPAETTSCR